MARGQAADPGRAVLDAAMELMPADRARHHEVPFAVPGGLDRLDLSLRYAPGRVEDGRNQLSLRLHDPAGFRGAWHRWAPEADVHVTPTSASPGFLAGPIRPGSWVVALDAHQIHAPGPCRVEIRIVGRRSAARLPLRTRHTPPTPSTRPVPPLPSVARAGWYRVDLHAHSIDCDGASTSAGMGRAAVR